MKTKKKTAKKSAPKKNANGNRGKETRRIILDAATKVFAMHPYNAASIRMIAAQGEFYHGLIRYHFPNKAKIFEAVAEEACQNLFNANKDWLQEISKLSAEKGLALYLDRFIEYYQNQPEVVRIVVQNLSHDNPISLPGYSHFAGLVTNAQKEFKKTFKGLMPSHVVSRFLNSLNILTIHYLGAGAFEAEIMGMAPKSDEYLQWIKETMLFIFLPVLKEIRASDF